jgi:hypothetical protein
MKRRDFLRATAIGGAAVLGPSVWTRRSGAQPFGEIPSHQASSMLPEHLRAESVLECFLLGGLTPWTSVYCVPGRGEASQTFAYTHYPQMIEAAETCGFDNAASNPFTFFAKDSAGLDVFFGPSMGRLLARPDVLKRVRVVVSRHRLGVHDTAIPLTTTGRGLGNPTAAALGTHVNRYFTDRGVAGSHPPPYSYVLRGNDTPFTFNDAGSPFLMSGLHPGHARSLVLALNDPARLNRFLNRTAIGTSEERAKYDALLGRYFEQYSARLNFGPGGEAIRAGGFQQLSQVFEQASQADVIRSLLPESLWEPWTPTASLCGTSAPSTVFGNAVAMGLRLATHLLTHPVHPARHCTVVDTGFRQADGGGGYDTHSEEPRSQATNLNNLFLHLLAFINEPGENDPNKIDLDKTLVILNTEFGRTPGRQGISLGRNHWQHGFAQIYIGGPIREEQSGVYGHIDDDGYATEFVTPAEHRIAALLALGIYPFEAHGYSSGDVQGEPEEGPAARSVIRRVFGHVV